MKYVIILICASIGILIADVIIRECYANQKILLSRLSAQQISKQIYSYAISAEQKDFSCQGKEVFTKKGAYRADFSKKANMRYSELNKLIAPNGELSGNFLDFAMHNYPSIRRKDIPTVISGYIAEVERNKKHMHDQILQEHPFITVDQFQEFRKRESGDSVGVYVIYNQSKDKYYVGQAKRLLFRVNQHFTGHGNGDVYADYVYGDDFLVQMLPLSSSEFSDIDEMERVMIKKYNAYTEGYNKTGGNK